ncbi:MAG: hypothetical protein QOE92_488 [Chloroflexota bacterium]|nr:hypothetical protein [Chloroflexota bacterium]
MSDAVLQDLIVRMAVDSEFADAIHKAPNDATQGMDVTAEEVGRLTSMSVDAAANVETLDPRQSKSSLFFMGATAAGGDGDAGGVGGMGVDSGHHVDLGVQQQQQGDAPGGFTHAGGDFVRPEDARPDIGGISPGGLHPHDGGGMPGDDPGSGGTDGAIHPHGGGLVSAAGGDDDDLEELEVQRMTTGDDGGSAVDLGDGKFHGLAGGGVHPVDGGGTTGPDSGLGGVDGTPHPHGGGEVASTGGDDDDLEELEVQRMTAGDEEGSNVDLGDARAVGALGGGSHPGDGGAPPGENSVGGGEADRNIGPGPVPGGAPHDVAHSNGDADRGIAPRPVPGGPRP